MSRTTTEHENKVIRQTTYPKVFQAGGNILLLLLKCSSQILKFLDSSIVKYIDVIYRYIKRLEPLTSELNDYSQIEAALLQH